MDVIPTPFPWYIAGPVIGLSVAGLYATCNRHLGMTGAYQALFDLVRGGTRHNIWQVWFLGGTIIGATAIAVLGGSPQSGLAYGALGEALTLPELIAVLFAGSVLIGYGARLAGGCTSGHGISGCAIRSPGSFVAVGMFVVTAVALTLAFDVLWGRI